MTLHHRIGRLAAACSLLILGGCALPTYVPQQGETLTTAKLYGFGKPFMCKDGKSYQLEVGKGADGGDVVQLPVDKRVAIWRHLSEQGYQVITSCNPTLSLVPRQGVTLAIHSGLAKQGCFIEAVREDASAASGVAFETSVGRPAC